MQKIKEEFNKIGWFIPPYIPLGKITRTFFKIGNIDNFHQDDLELILGELYTPSFLSSMLIERYSKLNNTSIDEKIAEDRERKRIAREIHDTLGHALTGISAGIDAVQVLIDVDTKVAKKQLQSVSAVVRNGIQDVRRSLDKLRPGALEKGSLREALLKMIEDYEILSKMQVELVYEWDQVDLDTAKEDIIIRIIQESITNSLRHGHANHVRIRMTKSNKYYVIEIKEDGIGSEKIQFGYGLTQMRERLGIIGGRVTFSGKKGFETQVLIPKRRGEEYD